MPHTVNRNNRNAVCHGMSTLRDNPCIELADLLIIGVRTFPTDGSRINQQFRSFQGHESGCFRIPLVPAYKHAKFTQRGLDRFEADISGSKIKLLIIGRIIGDMHLSVFSGYTAITVENDRRIMIQSRSTFFK